MTLATIPTVILARAIETTQGTYGLVTVPSRSPRVWYSVEEENQNNAPRVSSIPPGHYELHRRFYHHGGYDVFEVMNVPGRSNILFGHIANTEEDVEGCIGLGANLDFLEVVDEDKKIRAAKLAVVASKAACQDFMKMMTGVDRARLEVKAPLL